VFAQRKFGGLFPCGLGLDLINPIEERRHRLWIAFRRPVGELQRGGLKVRNPSLFPVDLNRGRLLGRFQHQRPKIFTAPGSAPEIARGTFGKLGALWRIAAPNLWLEPRYHLYLWLDRGSGPYFWLDLGGSFLLGFGHRFPCINFPHRQEHGRFSLAVVRNVASEARAVERVREKLVAFPVIWAFSLLFERTSLLWQKSFPVNSRSRKVQEISVNAALITGRSDFFQLALASSL
jgi:hypothetical protein